MCSTARRLRSNACVIGSETGTHACATSGSSPGSGCGRSLRKTAPMSPKRGLRCAGVKTNSGRGIGRGVGVPTTNGATTMALMSRKHTDTIPDGIDADEWDAVPEHVRPYYRPVPDAEADGLRALARGEVCRMPEVKWLKRKRCTPRLRTGPTSRCRWPVSCCKTRTRTTRCCASGPHGRRPTHVYRAATDGAATQRVMRAQHTCAMCGQYLPGDVDAREVFGSTRSSPGVAPGVTSPRSTCWVPWRRTTRSPRTTGPNARAASASKRGACGC